MGRGRIRGEREGGVYEHDAQHRFVHNRTLAQTTAQRDTIASCDYCGAYRVYLRSRCRARALPAAAESLESSCAALGRRQNRLSAPSLLAATVCRPSGLSPTSPSRPRGTLVIIVDDNFFYIYIYLLFFVYEVRGDRRPRRLADKKTKICAATIHNFTSVFFRNVRVRLSFSSVDDTRFPRRFFSIHIRFRVFFFFFLHASSVAFYCASPSAVQLGIFLLSVCGCETPPRGIPQTTRRSSRFPLVCHR